MVNREPSVADRRVPFRGAVPTAALECVCEYMEVMLLRSHWRLLGLDCPDPDNAKRSLADGTGLMEHQADAVAMAWNLIGHGMLPQLISWCDIRQNPKQAWFRTAVGHLVVYC